MGNYHGFECLSNPESEGSGQLRVGGDKESRSCFGNQLDFIRNRLGDAKKQRTKIMALTKIISKDKLIAVHGGEFIDGARRNIDNFIARRGIKFHMVSKGNLVDAIYALQKNRGGDAFYLDAPECKDGWSYDVFAWGGIVSVERFYHGLFDEHNVFRKRHARTVADAYSEMSLIDAGLDKEYSKYLKTLAMID